MRRQRARVAAAFIVVYLLTTGQMAMFQHSAKSGSDGDGRIPCNQNRVQTRPFVKSPRMTRANRSRVASGAGALHQSGAPHRNSSAEAARSVRYPALD